MEERISPLMEFLDKAHSPYHGAAAVCAELKKAGYKALQETDAWGLRPGGKYYVVRGSSSVIAFRIPETTPTGFMMAAAHDDYPGLAVKDNLEKAGAYTRLDVETYGGMIMSSWLDRPLSMAGRVMVRTPRGLVQRLVDVDRDLLLIPNVAIHLNREVNSGYKWNPAVDLQPLLGGKDAAGKLKKELETLAGGEILGADLRLYLRQKASRWGAEREFISAAGLDDLLCVWCSLQGFLAAGESKAIPVLCVFDSEEVGSSTVAGADGNLLETVLERICRSRGLDKNRMLSQSFLVSADNGHALHPNRPELSDRENAPVLGGGVMVKFNSNRRYTTDGLSAAVFRQVCQNAGVQCQRYYNRADIPGGSTLGSLSLHHVSVPSVDVGLPQLAMHSAYETAAVQDVLDLCQVFTEYFGTDLGNYLT